jgi:predicted RNase H-like HicB family nuclease
MSEQKVHVVIYKDAESDQWVAQCLEYDVTTQGDNESHALDMIREAVEIYIDASSKEELEMLYQPIEGAPKVHEVSINAQSLLLT